MAKPDEAELILDDEEIRTIYPKIDPRRINFYLNLSVRSAKIEKIWIHYSDGGIKELPRCQIHAFLSAKRGCFKSTRIDQMRAIYPDDIVLKDQVSYAALVGSIDKESKTYNVPLAIRADGKVLVLDEIVRDKKGDFTKALLQLSERGEYRKDVALTSKPTSQYDGRFTVQNGEITVKSRFALIMASMYSPGMFSRSQSGAALLNRMIVLYFDLTSEQKISVFNSSQPLYSDLGFNPPGVVHISTEDYQKIFEFWKSQSEEAVRNGYESYENRSLGDLLRTFAVLGRHEETAYAEIIKLGNPKRFTVSRRR